MLALITLIAAIAVVALKEMALTSYQPLTSKQKQDLATASTLAASYVINPLVGLTLTASMLIAATIEEAKETPQIKLPANKNLNKTALVGIVRKQLAEINKVNFFEIDYKEALRITETLIKEV